MMEVHSLIGKSSKAIAVKCSVTGKDGEISVHKHGIGA
jgi:hypothetical protein